MNQYEVDITKNGKHVGGLKGTGIVLLVSNATGEKAVDVDGTIFGTHSEHVLVESVVDLLNKIGNGPQLLLEVLYSRYIKGEIKLDLEGAFERAGLKQRR